MILVAIFYKIPTFIATLFSSATTKNLLNAKIAYLPMRHDLFLNIFTKHMLFGL